MHPLGAAPVRINMLHRLNPAQVCRCLGVTNYALRYWRDPSRLPGGTSNPLYLPAIPDPNNRNVVWYRTVDVAAFVVRNERYRDRLAAKIAPPAGGNFSNRVMEYLCQPSA